MNRWKTTTRAFKPLPYPVYLWTVIGLVFTGLAASAYLAVSHYRVYTDMGYRSFCAISKAINCDTVSQSPYSIFWGVPVPVWGVIGYTFLLILLGYTALHDADKRRMWASFLGATFVYSCCSLILAFVSGYYVRSYCIVCIATYGVNFALLFFAWLIRRRFPDSNLFQGFRRDVRFLMNKKWVTLSVLLVFVLGVAATKHVFPPYWRLVPPDHSAMASTGTTADGYPWIGSSNPQLEIVEFSDYLCFQCRKMHFFLRQLIQRYPDRIRLVHRNYPMDHEFNFIVKDPAFHNGSGKLALLALYAELEGKFWQMNDELYQAVGHSTHIDIKDIASRTGIDARRLALAIQEPRLREKLRVDVWQGMKLRMTGTPSYLINGKVYQGLIPPEVLKSVLNQ